VKAYSSSLGSFCADEAWVEIGKKRSLANNHPRILDDSVLAEFIVEKIESYWSPEQIAGKWRAENNEVLCHETIYQYIYRNKPQLIKLYLRRKGKKYRKERDKGKGGIPEMVMIDDRPKAVDGRESFGHWEGDTVIGKNYKQAIVTNVERKSGFLMATKVEHKQAELVADVFRGQFADLPEELRISVTLDQGSEFAWHTVISGETKLDVYFCHKASPWERGLNENTNGLLRQFIPKGTDFSQVSSKDLQHYVNLLNGRPRKRHGYLTPAEVLQKELDSLCTSI